MHRGRLLLQMMTVMIMMTLAVTLMRHSSYQLAVFVAVVNDDLMYFEARLTAVMASILSHVWENVSAQLHQRAMKSNKDEATFYTHDTNIRTHGITLVIHIPCRYRIVYRIALYRTRLYCHVIFYSVMIFSTNAFCNERTLNYQVYSEPDVSSRTLCICNGITRTRRPRRRVAVV